MERCHKQIAFLIIKDNVTMIWDIINETPVNYKKKMLRRLENCLFFRLESEIQNDLCSRLLRSL